MIIRDACNVCSNSYGNIVARSFLLRQTDCPDHNWRNYLAYIGKPEITVDFLVCGSCGHIYQRQILDDAEQEILRVRDLEQVLSVNEYFSFRSTSRIINAKRFDGVIRFLTNNLGNDFSGRRVLDVGGREGGFGVPLIDMGGDYTTIDVDDYGETAIPGATFLRGDFDTYDFERPFDLIALNHVLEHVVHPSKTLSRCRELLNPGGFIFIDIPNLPIWPGTQHRSEFPISELLLETCRRVGFSLTDAESILLGYGPSIIRDYRLPCQKVERPKSLQPRNYRDYALNLLSDYHYDIVRSLTDDQKPFVIYGLNEASRQLLQPVPLERSTLICFVDDDSALWGSEFRGKAVMSPETLNSDSKYVVILTPNRDETRHKLQPLADQGVYLLANHRYL